MLITSGQEVVRLADRDRLDEWVGMDDRVGVEVAMVAAPRLLRFLLLLLPSAFGESGIPPPAPAPPDNRVVEVRFAAEGDLVPVRAVTGAAGDGVRHAVEGVLATAQPVIVFSLLAPANGRDDVEKKVQISVVWRCSGRKSRETCALN